MHRITKTSSAVRARSRCGCDIFITRSVLVFLKHLQSQMPFRATANEPGGDQDFSANSAWSGMFIVGPNYKHAAPLGLKPSPNADSLARQRAAFAKQKNLE